MSLFLIAVILSVSYYLAVAMSAKSIAFVGSYSNHISLCSFNSWGTITFVNSYYHPSINNPSWLAITNSKKYLYAVSEVESYEGKYSGAIGAYKIDPHTHELIFINQVTTNGASPCHAYIDEQDENIYISNYCSGTLAVIKLLEDGSLGNITQVISHNENEVSSCDGPSHVHEVVIQGTTAACNDLGMVFIWPDMNHRVCDVCRIGPCVPVLCN